MNKKEVVDYLMNHCDGKDWDTRNDNPHHRVEELELAIQSANEKIRKLEVEIEYILLETRKNAL